MVKSILKQSGVTLSQFASDLNISRPTLDNYIETYDSGQKISNGFYYDIFDFLFENPNISDVDFIKRYKYMKEHYGMSSIEPQVSVTKLKSGFNLPKGDYQETLEQIQQIIDNDRQNPDTPIDIYKIFLGALKFKTNEIYDFYKFYSLYHGIEKIGSLNDEQKKLYGLLHEALNKSEDKNLSIDPILLNNFVAHANKTYENRNHKILNIKNAISDKLTEVIEDELQKGNLSDMDLNDIIELIKKKI